MKKVLILFIAMVAFAPTQAQTKAAGVTVPNTMSAEGQKLVLNGVGVREKFWMDMYAGALYLNAKSSNASEIMSSNQAMALKIHIVSKLISSEKMTDAVDEGFQNATGGKTQSIASEINTFKSYFSEEISKNDVFDIVYVPEVGVTVSKNGKNKGVIKGLEFKKALFGIWLSEKPADDDLKDAMLGKK
ncbi:Chalcone isomerase-like [Gillisia sp. Hel1_33_143]|uniref:chalcone isomerase family protein n=1 Tax=unclassified Gillisia TaxID=2615025 RepID=UPI0005523028|nr:MULTISPECIES: chalcone isomerase family protein [unclassified Gillisia]SDS72958.1 Chalcone isomerase-like [Gillisia sp. Hel1_33_143]